MTLGRYGLVEWLAILCLRWGVTKITVGGSLKKKINLKWHQEDTDSWHD